jgi:RimJ/RimL family protein N-acetyltransferase
MPVCAGTTAIADSGTSATWSRPRHEARGVATRAVRLLSAFAFAELGAERIEICAEPENEPSLRVAAAAGFTREGVLRRYRAVRGVRRDMVMQSLLPGELG